MPIMGVRQEKTAKRRRGRGNGDDSNPSFSICFLKLARAVLVALLRCVAMNYYYNLTPGLGVPRNFSTSQQVQVHIKLLYDSQAQGES
jgi:hypothetical protein